jgi:hypothetical protein
LDIIANHNRAFRTISAHSKYCKVVSADDWLYPECLTRMVSLAEANPSVGIVASYQLSGGDNEWYVRVTGLPYYRSVVPGSEICRLQLLGSIDIFGCPTSNLYRADLVRSTDSFYPNSTAEADVSACFKWLEDTDFGLVHQVLSYERIHNARMTTESRSRGAYVSSRLGDLLVYGSLYLQEDEFKKRLKKLMDEWYAILAIGAVNCSGAEFWSYQKKRLKELGYTLDKIRLGRAICAKVLELVLNPKDTIEKLARRKRGQVRSPGTRA